MCSLISKNNLSFVFDKKNYEIGGVAGWREVGLVSIQLTSDGRLGNFDAAVLGITPIISRVLHPIFQQIKSTSNISPYAEIDRPLHCTLLFDRYKTYVGKYNVLLWLENIPPQRIFRTAEWAVTRFIKNT